MDWRNSNLVAGEIELRPWRNEDAEVVGSPRDPDIDRYFGRPIGDPPPPPPDPDAASYAICQSGQPVGRIWFRPGVRPFEIGYFGRATNPEVLTTSTQASLPEHWAAVRCSSLVVAKGPVGSTFVVDSVNEVEPPGAFDLWVRRL